MRIVIAHGGTTSSPLQRRGTRKAAQAGLKAMDAGGPLEAVVEACRVLEDDPAFHAGLGGTFRFDGRTLELDAGISVSDGRFGGVSCIQRVRNPVLVARALVDLPANVLVGPAAEAFARRLGHPVQENATAKARREWKHTVRKIEKGKAGPDEIEWKEEDLRRAWNYPTPFEEVFPKGYPPPDPAKASRPEHADTVGAVATDGRTFAAAASTSGMTGTLMGRLGDAVVLGGGILATEDGAVACSGNGDRILRARLATRILDWMRGGMSPEVAAQKGIALFPESVDAAVVVLGRDGDHAGVGNRRFAFSVARGK